MLGVLPAVARKRALDPDRAVDPVAGVGEREEEAVALDVELDAAVRAQLLAHDLVVGAEDAVGPAVAEAFRHLREPLHVAE